MRTETMRYRGSTVFYIKLISINFLKVIKLYKFFKAYVLA